MKLSHATIPAVVLMMSVSPLGVARAQPADPGITVFIGTYTRGWACPPQAKDTPACSSKGIYRARFDPRTGSIKQLTLAAESDNPSYLAIHPGGRFLYAVNEVGDWKGEKSGAVSAFAIEPSGQLRLINQLSSHGADPCHVSLTASGSHVLVANYSGGNISSYAVGSQGELKEGSTVADKGDHGPHANQNAAHAHFILEGPTPGLIYVADLGLDKVLLYDLDPGTSQLKPHAAAPFAAVLPPGSGPRHLAIHPNKKFLYTNNELSTAASVFARDPTTGVIKEPAVQTISTIPLPYGKRSNNAEIQISADGRFAYVSNRGHDSIAAFAVDESTGKLTFLNATASGGREPRDFKIDPSGRFLLVAHQNSDDVVVFKVQQNGKIERGGTKLKVSKPVNFAFWQAPGT